MPETASSEQYFREASCLNFGQTPHAFVHRPHLLAIIGWASDVLSPRKGLPKCQQGCDTSLLALSTHKYMKGICQNDSSRGSVCLTFWLVSPQAVSVATVT